LPSRAMPNTKAGGKWRGGGVTPIGTECFWWVVPRADAPSTRPNPRIGHPSQKVKNDYLCLATSPGIVSHPSQLFLPRRRCVDAPSPSSNFWS
jgi:hypothetical protein